MEIAKAHSLNSFCKLRLLPNYKTTITKLCGMQRNLLVIDSKPNNKKDKMMNQSVVAPLPMTASMLDLSKEILNSNSTPDSSDTSSSSRWYNKKNSDDFVCCISLKRFVVMSISLWTTTTMLLFALLLGMSVTAHFVIKRKVEVGLVMKDCAGTIKQIDELLRIIEEE